MDEQYTSVNDELNYEYAKNKYDEQMTLSSFLYNGFIVLFYRYCRCFKKRSHKSIS